MSIFRQIATTQKINVVYTLPFMAVSREGQVQLIELIKLLSSFFCIPTCCRTFVGDTFARHAGYNDLAEENDIIILYPQVTLSKNVPFNPNGCWDW